MQTTDTYLKELKNRFIQVRKAKKIIYNTIDNQIINKIKIINSVILEEIFYIINRKIIDEYSVAKRDAIQYFDRKTVKTITSYKLTRFLLLKKIIILNLIAIILFLTDVKIVESENGLTIFGIGITGIETQDVIIYFLIYLTILNLILVYLKVKLYYVSGISIEYIKKFLIEEKKSIVNIIELLRKLRINFEAYEEKSIQLKTDYNEILSFIEKNEEEKETSFNFIESNFLIIFSSILTIISFVVLISSLQYPFNLYAVIFLVVILFLFCAEAFPYLSERYKFTKFLKEIDENKK